MEPTLCHEPRHAIFRDSVPPSEIGVTPPREGVLTNTLHWVTLKRLKTMGGIPVGLPSTGHALCVCKTEERTTYLGSTFGPLHFFRKWTALWTSLPSQNLSSPSLYLTFYTWLRPAPCSAAFAIPQPHKRQTLPQSSPRIRACRDRALSVFLILLPAAFSSPGSKVYGDRKGPDISLGLYLLLLLCLFLIWVLQFFVEGKKPPCSLHVEFL